MFRRKISNGFEVYIENKYYGSYETVLEAANVVDELMKEDDKESILKYEQPTYFD